MVRSALALVTALAVAGARAEAAVYTDSASFQAAIGSTVTSAVVPPYSVTYTDSNGTFSPPATRSGANIFGPSPGTIGGEFGCFGEMNPCSGAYRETITFPVQITGFSGQLSYFDLDLEFDSGSLLGLPASAFAGPYPNPQNKDPYHYVGFYGQTFAPTNTVTFTWTPGLSSIDGQASFTLSPASVLIATPEPASIALILLPMIGATILRRRVL